MQRRANQKVFGKSARQDTLVGLDDNNILYDDALRVPFEAPHAN